MARGDAGRFEVIPGGRLGPPAPLDKLVAEFGDRIRAKMRYDRALKIREAIARVAVERPDLYEHYRLVMGL